MTCEQPLARVAAESHRSPCERGAHLAVRSHAGGTEALTLHLPRGDYPCPHGLRALARRLSRRRQLGGSGSLNATDQIDPVEQRQAEPPGIASSVDLAAGAVVALAPARTRVARSHEHG